MTADTPAAREGLEANGEQPPREGTALGRDLGLTPEEEALMRDGAVALRELLAAEPTTEEELVAVLSRRLAEPITPNTWAAVIHSLTSYVGELGFQPLGWAGTADPADESRLRLLEVAGGPAVGNLARRITAQFGDELRYAWEVAGQLENNWRGLNREVYFDLINQRYHIRIDVEKYGGEKTVLGGPPDSILSFATFLLGALRFTGDSGAFSEGRLREFADEVDPLTELLKPRLEELAAVEDDRAAEASA